LQLCGLLAGECWRRVLVEDKGSHKRTDIGQKFPSMSDLRSGRCPILEKMEMESDDHKNVSREIQSQNNLTVKKIMMTDVRK